MDEPTVGVPLKTAMDRFLRHLSSAPVDTLTGLHNHWEEIVGPNLSQVSQPISLVDSVLAITCDDSTWAAQLKWMERSIRTSVETLFPGVEVKRIQVRQRHR